MTISRRFFLRKGTLAGVSTAFLLGNLRLAAANSLGINSAATQGLPISAAALSEIEKLSQAAFTKYRYTLFSFRSEVGKAVAMELVRVDIDEKAAELGIDCFTLSFQCRDTSLPQDTYLVEHKNLGAFRMFIVPSNWESNGADYIAVFNRLAKVQR